jgi:hypothetical protein
MNHRLIAFLDLRESDKTRNELRAMEKNIRTNKHYLGKDGRVYFFKFDSEGQKHGFFMTIMKGIHDAGDRAVLTRESFDLKKIRK